MFFEYEQPIKQKERNYEFYNKGYGLRKHPRVLLTLPIELTLCAENRQTFFLEGEAKDISASGLYMKIIKPQKGMISLETLSEKDDLTLQNPIHVKVHLTFQNPTMEEYDIEGRIVWASDIVVNPEDGSHYIFCGIQFEEEIKFTIQMQQIAIKLNNDMEKLDLERQRATNPTRTLEELVAFYNEDVSANQIDQLQSI